MGLYNATYDPATGTKICSACKQRKLLELFAKRALSKIDGRNAVCKDCNRDYMRTYAPKNRDPKKHAKNQNRWYHRNKNKERAHRAVRIALKNGVLKKPDNCSDCGSKTDDIEGHHEDYSKLLDVIWLCPECHGKRHRDNYDN